MDNYNTPEFDNNDEFTVVEGFRADSQPEASGIPQPDPSYEQLDTQEGQPHEVDDLTSVVKEKKKSKRNPFEKRIDQITYQREVKEQENLFLREQNAQQEAILAQQQAQIQQMEDMIQAQKSVADKAIEGRFHDNESAIRQALKEAKDSGDSAREVDLIDQLAEIKAQKNAYEVYKVQQVHNQQQLNQQEPYVPYESNRVMPNFDANRDLEFEQWQQENPWYVYNPALRHEAEMIAEDLAKTLAFNNEHHVIGTPQFRESVKRIMSSQYGYKDPQSHSSPSPSPVGPVNQRPSQAQAYMQNNPGSGVGHLSPQDIALARHFPRNPGESEAEFFKRYQKAKSFPAAPRVDGNGSQFRFVAPL